MKRVLITGGCVGGNLDSNKMIMNRIRGIWAAKFADYLAIRGYPVTFLVPDVNTPSIPVRSTPIENLTVVKHSGYHDYALQCEGLAMTHDCAVMAGAVVNWLPAEPIVGKMKTEGFSEGDVIQVPFVLVPRVIDRMKRVNPNLTLIGCKMLVGSTPDELTEAAYHVLLRAKCNVVVANDMGLGLRDKHLVYPDRTVVTYKDDFEGLFQSLRAVIDDVHYHTIEGYPREWVDLMAPSVVRAREILDHVLDKYRERFIPRMRDAVFGSVAVPLDVGEAWLVTPREKGRMFTSAEAVVVRHVDHDSRVVHTIKGKATLNAPLLIRVGQANAQIQAGGGFLKPVVLHLHEQLPGVPMLPYAPPGTMRDNLRELPTEPGGFNIRGHGFLSPLSGTGEHLDGTHPVSSPATKP